MTAPAAPTSAEHRAQLRQIHFLDGLTDTDYHFLSSRVRSVACAKGETLFEEGAERAGLFLLTTGSVAIEKGAGTGGGPVRLATLGAGEVIGEGMLLDESRHGTTAVALEPTGALMLGRASLTEIVKERPTLYAALLGRAAHAISQRLRATDATLVGRGRALGFGGAGTRREHDLLGDRDVPAEALYGVQTLRALENFPITGTPIREFPELVSALGAVKEAAARANAELGLLGPELADAICRAAREVRGGRHHEHFLVDVIQGGAGTSTNITPSSAWPDSPGQPGR